MLPGFSPGLIVEALLLGPLTDLLGKDYASLKAEEGLRAAEKWRNSIEQGVSQGEKVLLREV